MPTDVEIAWATGFFEGEGSISITKRDDTLHVRVAQVDREPLELLKEWFGGHIRDKCAGRRVEENRKPCFEWNICTKDVLEFFTAVAPYVVRPRVKERMRLAREFYAKKTDRTLSKVERRCQMDALFEALTKLNRSGRWHKPGAGESASLPE